MFNASVFGNNTVLHGNLYSKNAIKATETGWAGVSGRPI